MKRYISSNAQVDTITVEKPVADMSEKEFLRLLCKRLNDLGIDTSMHTYEMKASAYERYGSGNSYVVKFKCPGDYLAYFAMVGHTDVKTLDGLANTIYEQYFEYFDFDEGFSNMIEYCGTTVKSAAIHAKEYWWGDGDDYIYYLVNNDTQDVLYQSGDAFDDEYEDEDDSWDNWED